MIIGLLAMTIVSICPSCANPPATRQPKGGDARSTKAPMLKMVYIRTSSSGGLKQLRAMPIDIIRVRPDPQRPTDKHTLVRNVIVEAVVPTEMLPKLRAKGFDVSEVPPKQK